MTVIPDNATLCTCGSHGSRINSWGRQARPKDIKRKCPRCKGLGWYVGKVK